MSETEYKELVERVLHSVSHPMISTDTGVEAVQQVSKLAAQGEIVWAIVGGLAMHLYGSQRLTKDVDIHCFKEFIAHARSSADFWR